jgi:hypothetical protein
MVGCAMFTEARRLFSRGATVLRGLIRRGFSVGAPAGVIQNFAIPSYFHSDEEGDSDWSEAAQAASLLGIVVINPSSGPAYTPEFRNLDASGLKRLEYENRIVQMHQAGADVLGYVTTNYRDSRGNNTVQGEHTFTLSGGTSVATERTGWWTGFGPIQIRSENKDTGAPVAPPGGLAVNKDYFWIATTETTGGFATSDNGAPINLTPANDPHAKHLMGLSRTLKNIDNVFFEIDEYYARWPTIDGMFFDEMNDVGDDQDREYYRRIFNYVKAKGGKALVVQNPGKSFPVSMRGYADVFLSYEGSSSNYSGKGPEIRLPRESLSFWHAIYDCPAADMPGVIAASSSKGARYVYVTNKSTWNEIADYFGEEIRVVRFRNNPPVKMVQ